MAVGFIGLGNIGAPIARRLLGWPTGLVVYDVRPEASQPFAEAGAVVADSAAALAADCDVTSVMVLNDAQVRDVVGKMLPACRTGSVIAVHSTISEQTALDVSQEAGKQGVHVVD